MYSTCKCIIDNSSFINSGLLFAGGIGGGIRPVIIPNDTSSRFLSVASANTRRNVETCGILGGKLVSPYMFI